MKKNRFVFILLCALQLTLAPAQAQQPQAEKLKPSAAAIAADPGASEQTVRDGYSKPTSHIRAMYERLDPALFIYKPYYQGDNRYFYYVEADPNAKNSPREFNDQCYKWFMSKAQDEYGVGWTRIGTFFGGTPGHDGQYVLYGEHAMHAGFAEVIADPGSSNPFNHFLHACSILDISSESAVSYGGPYNGTEKVIRYKKAGKFFYIDAVEYMETCALMAAHSALSSGDAKEQERCQALAKKHMSQNEEIQAKKMDFYLANGSAAKAAASAMTMAEIPKPGMSDASLEATFKSLAMNSGALSKEVSIKKVIIRDAGWNYDRNELGVVTARYKGAYLIYSVGGKTMMKEMSFKQPATGGGAFGSWQYRGIGTETRTITDWK